MKTVLAFSIFAFALTSQAASVPNGVARLQLQRLLFGNETTKTESVSLPGKQSNGLNCSIGLRKTRYGVYVGVETVSGDEDISVGLTNSHFTTQNLDFVLDEANGVVTFSRMGVVNIDERGEDYGNETASIAFERTEAGTKVKSIEVTYEALSYEEDADHNPVYTSNGDVHVMDCKAF
jgi:hypothetical protein